MSAPSLAEIVRALGGELYAGGRRANVPAPGHSAADRSVSLLLAGDRVVVHAFAGDDWRTVLDDLRRRGLVDARGCVAGPSGAAAAEMLSPRARKACARTLWEEAHAIEGTLSERHCRLRGVAGDLSSELRHHPALPSAVYRTAGRRRPAFLAAVRDATGDLTGVEATYLSVDGRRALLPVPRKTVGVVPVGAAVRLQPVGRRLVVAEGVFTALSAGAHFAAPAWALLSAGRMAGWRPPEGVTEVIVAADRGAAGERAARTLVARLRGLGLAAGARWPPAPHGDWNEAVCASGEEDGRDGMGGS